MQTGDVSHSLRCDRHDQLHLALRVIADEDAGLKLPIFRISKG
jgi:GTP cyclohydrolase II